MRGEDEEKDGNEEAKNDDAGVSAPLLWYNDESWTATAVWNTANSDVLAAVNAARAAGHVEVR